MWPLSGRGVCLDEALHLDDSRVSSRCGLLSGRGVCLDEAVLLESPGCGLYLEKGFV